jgi:hypothetical protein
MLAVVTRGLVETPLDTLAGAPAVRAESPRQGVWKDPAVRPFVVYGFVLVSIQAVNVSSLGFVVIDMLQMPRPRRRASSEPR